jgi:hypothetical protein
LSQRRSIAASHTIQHSISSFFIPAGSALFETLSACDSRIRSLMRLWASTRLWSNGRCRWIPGGSIQLVGWLVDIIYPDPSHRSDMQATTTIYIRVRTCRVFHFLKMNLGPHQGLPWPICRSQC